MIPWSSFHATVHRLLRQRPLLPSGSSLLVAVSGGQDSICLLKLLLDLQPKWKWLLHVIHCDHRWRTDSTENAAFVEDLCQQWQVPCQVVTAETIPATEADARHWRYSVFESLAVKRSLSHVLTGHTATDRAETLLYNLMRGSGANGLQALTWERPLSAANPTICLVRPLLGLTRQDTALFCDQFHLTYWQDVTNQDPTYARNRIRLEVMPYLRQHFNTDIETTLAQTAEVLTAEVSLLEQLTDDLYQQAVQAPGHEGAWRILRSHLKPAPLALQRRVMRRVLQQIMTVQVSFDHIEKLIALINAPNRTQTDPFPGGTIALVENDWIVLEPFLRSS